MVRLPEPDVVTSISPPFPPRPSRSRNHACASASRLINSASRFRRVETAPETIPIAVANSFIIGSAVLMEFEKAFIMDSATLPSASRGSFNASATMPMNSNTGPSLAPMFSAIAWMIGPNASKTTESVSTRSCNVGPNASSSCVLRSATDCPSVARVSSISSWACRDSRIASLFS